MMKNVEKDLSKVKGDTQVDALVCICIVLWVCLFLYTPKKKKKKNIKGKSNQENLL